MKLVSVLLQGMFLIDLLKILEVEGALVVDTLVDTKTGTVLDRNESVTAVGALVFDRLGMDAAINEGSAADLALVLTMTAVVVIEILMRSTADRADFVLGDRVAAPAADRTDLLAILVFIVCDEELPVLFEEGNDERELIDFELLILR